MEEDTLNEIILLLEKFLNDDTKDITEVKLALAKLYKFKEDLKVDIAVNAAEASQKISREYVMDLINNYKK